MVDRLQLNARKPESNEYGEQVLARMNRSHQELSLWGMSHLDFCGVKNALDVGCGGGKNIENLLSKTDGACVFGIDYSPQSVKKSIENNQKAVDEGRVQVICGTAEALPYKDESFELVTAFETVYYWENITSCFESVRRILKDGGQFLVCNEDCDTVGIEEAAKALEMTLYTDPELEALMRQAGFSKVFARKHQNGRWVCAVGIK